MRKIYFLICALAMTVCATAANMTAASDNQTTVMRAPHQNLRMAKRFAMAKRTATAQLNGVKAAAPKTAETITLDISQSEVTYYNDPYSGEEYDIMLATKIYSDNRFVNLIISNSTLDGTFSLGNGVSPYSAVMGMDYDPYYAVTACNVTITKTGSNQYSCAGSLSYEYDDNTYTFSTTLTYPKGSDDVVKDTITISNVEVDDSYPATISFDASTSLQGNVKGAIKTYGSSWIGDFTSKDFSSFTCIGSSYIDSNSADSWAKCEKIGDNQYKLNAYLVMEDKNIYVIENAIFTIEEKKTKTRDETIIVPAAVLTDQTVAGYFMANGYNADKTRLVNLYFIGKNITGTFNEENMNPSSCWVCYREGTASAEWYDLVNANFTVSENEDAYTISGKMLAIGEKNKSDIPEFSITMTIAKEKPAPWDTLGVSTVTDGVVAYLLGDITQPVKYEVTTLKKSNSYKLVAMFGSASPAYSSITDLAKYSKADIEIDASNPNNVTITKQNIGWKGKLFNELYEISATNGTLFDNVITLPAANIKFYEDGDTPYKGYGDLIINLPTTTSVKGITVTGNKTANRKAIVNGQIVIEKDGVRYNVLGVKIK